MDTFKLTKSVYEQICNTIGKLPPECGGILGAKVDACITEFYFDETGKSTPRGYAPNVTAVNSILTNDWMPRGILMVGIVHSHANGNSAPSCMDVEYGIRILRALDTVDKFYLPIVTIINQNIQITGYVIYYDEKRGFLCRNIECEVIT